MPPDWRPPKTIRDPAAKKRFHRNAAKVCAICGVSRDISLHHVFDRDDVFANWAPLCGDGVRGCHGAITRHDRFAREKLGAFVVRYRHDIVRHVESKIGTGQAVDWFARRLFADVSPILIGSTTGGHNDGG